MTNHYIKVSDEEINRIADQLLGPKKILCSQCGEKEISDPIWDFCSMDCYYEHYLNKIAKITGIKRNVLEGTEAGDTRLYD